MHEDPESGKNKKVTIAMNIGAITITVSGNDKAELQELLEMGIELAKTNYERIKGFQTDIPDNAFKSQNNGQVTSLTKSAPQSGSPTTGVENIVQVFEDGSIKFSNKKIFDLGGSEVAAIVMYALNKPLGPTEIASILTGAWRTTTKDNIYVYFSRELKSRITKTNDGKYMLNGAGKNWVEEELIKKCQ